jgi:gliding motility-associated-like protein
VFKFSSSLNNCNFGPNAKLRKDTLNVIVSKTSLYPRNGPVSVNTIHKDFKAEPQRLNFVCSSQPIPQAYLPDDTLVCGSSYTINAGAENAACKKLWSTGDTGMSITVHKTGKYWLQSSYGSCSSSDTMLVAFRNDLLPLLKKHFSICANDSFYLHLDHFPDNIYWVTPVGDTLTGNSHWVRDSGDYRLFLSAQGSCDFTDTVHLTVYALPKATAGPDTTLCYMQSYTMQGSGGITYLWKPAYYLSNDTIANPIARLPQKQRYLLVVSNMHGCRDSSYVMMSVKQPLSVKLSASSLQVCRGGDISLSAAASGGDSLHYAYSWSTGAIGDKIQYFPAGSGYVKVTLTDGCSLPASDSVYVGLLPEAHANFSAPDTVQEQKPVGIHNLSRNADSYVWQWSQGVSDQKLPQITFDSTGWHRIFLSISNNSGCSDTVSRLVYVIPKGRIYLPNVFTPGNDTLNEVFAPITYGITEYKLTVYNRWGELIYTGTNHGWNGTFEGAPVQEGIYAYVLEATDMAHDQYYLNGVVEILKL